MPFESSLKVPRRRRARSSRRLSSAPTSPPSRGSTINRIRARRRRTRRTRGRTAVEGYERAARSTRRSPRLRCASSEVSATRTAWSGRGRTPPAPPSGRGPLRDEEDDASGRRGLPRTTPDGSAENGSTRPRADGGRTARRRARAREAFSAALGGSGRVFVRTFGSPPPRRKSPRRTRVTATSPACSSSPIRPRRRAKQGPGIHNVRPAGERVAGDGRARREHLPGPTHPPPAREAPRPRGDAAGGTGAR